MAESRSALTPMMQQYMAAKRQSPDALLLFRMGDFYELFFEDAVESSQLLGLTLTSRDKGDDPIPMAGFPYHQLEPQLARLIAAGRRVAICEQVEDPKLAQGLVKREITRIVTAGTLTDDTMLNPRQANYLLAVAWPTGQIPPGRAVGVAWFDLAMASMVVAALKPNELAEELARLEPSEILLPEGQRLPDSVRLATTLAVTHRPAFAFQPTNAVDLVRKHFRVATLDGFGIPDEHCGLEAAGALLAYLYETQRSALPHLHRLTPYSRGGRMLIDPMTRRSLELTRTLRDQRREGTLLGTLDMTQTAAGARMLAAWIGEPLVAVEQIRARQSAVAEWKDDPATRRKLRELLAKTHDLERMAARVSTGRTNPRDLAALRESLRQLPAVKARLAGRSALENMRLEDQLDLLPDLRELLEQALVDEPPLAVREGGLIRDGYHIGLDELRDIARGGRQWMVDFQKNEIARTGITNLKVGFNKVFGYYVEVTNSQLDRVPADYVRKQTIKGGERYITPELKEYEDKVLSAEEKSNDLEYELFLGLRDRVTRDVIALTKLGETLAELDVFLTLAELASAKNYCRPTIVDTGELRIIGGRHPVLDSLLPPGQFVPNDTILGPRGQLDGDGRFYLITGPNMAGKSTYIRQVALITLLAQMGSFVPAEAATIGVVDRIFARVGASDELGRGQSTFMVEMAETANILHNATSNSLVILDEIGRGTSTYDGVSLAWAISEQLHDKVGCRTLFATHYHELIDLQKTLLGLRNYSIAVREWKEEILFLHQIVAGGADRSYGIHVARLAGLPAEVLARAKVILDLLERDPFGQQSASAAQPKKHRRAYHQLSLFPATTAHPVLDEIRGLVPNQLPPEVALQRLAEWRDRLLSEDR